MFGYSKAKIMSGKNMFIPLTDVNSGISTSSGPTDISGFVLVPSTRKADSRDFCFLYAAIIPLPCPRSTNENR